MSFFKKVPAKTQNMPAKHRELRHFLKCACKTPWIASFSTFVPVNYIASLLRFCTPVYIYIYIYIRVHRLPLNLSDFNLLFFGGVVWYKNGKYEVSAHSIKVKVCLVGFNCQFFYIFFTFLAPFSDFLTFSKLLFFC